MKNYRILNLEGSILSMENNGDLFKLNTTDEITYKNKDGKEVKIKPDKLRLFTATMPYSLETDRAFERYPDEVLNDNLEIANEEYILEDKKELFTKLFINLKFNKNLFDEKTEEDENGETIIHKNIISKKKLRQMIYTSKLLVDGEIYCFFKRGASKARTANVIYCKSKYYNELLKPSLLGLSFDDEEKEYDLTSKEAYTSLIMSGITGTLNIKSDEILIINDIMSPKFPAKQSLTLMDANGVIKQHEDTYEVENNMTDGEALADESIFIENEYLNKNTTALLRNDFLKANTVRTRLQEYYKELFKDDYENAKVWDIFRGWIDAKKIKLVITPSSCKYLKFKDQFDSEKDCFLDWLDKIPEKFGVVKTDHEGNYGYSNRLSYQMWNGMNLSRQEVLELIQDELDYFKLLKDNTLVDSSTLDKMTKNNKRVERAKRNEMSYFLNLVNNKKDEVSSNDMIADLLKRNSDFRFTRKFKDWKNEQLQDYIANLRLGKVRIKNSLYAIMVSCPYEFLVATTKENNIIDSCIMDGWECYCPAYAEDTELLAIRNPEINQGNNGYFTNKFHEEYKLFGYWENNKPKFDFVVFVNSFNVDVENRLQGCDWDVDSCFLSDHKILVKHAKESQEYSTPTNGIKGTSQKRKNNSKELAKLDNYLGGSTMNIGKIVNKSAIFNAYMYHGINNGYSSEYIKACYNVSSTLSSCSQIAIDMAKKSFVDEKNKPLSLTKIMNNLNQTSYKNEEGKDEKILQYKIDKDNEEEITLEKYLLELIKLEEDENYIVKYELVEPKDMEKELEQYKDDVEMLDNEKDSEKKKSIKENLADKYNELIKVHSLKMIVPKFFQYVAKDNSYRIPTFMDCSMDYLNEVLDGVKTKAMGTDTEKLETLLVLQKDLNGRSKNIDKIDAVRKIVDECQSIINKNSYDVKDGGEEKKKKANLRKWAKKSAIKKIQDEQLNDKTILRIINRAFNIDKKYKGSKMYRLDAKGNKIEYVDPDAFNEEFDDFEDLFFMTVREFKEMSLLTLTLLYNAYKESFKKCFIEKKSKNVKVESFWK